jgi:hypothetical protein
MNQRIKRRNLERDNAELLFLDAERVGKGQATLTNLLVSERVP